jgi:cell pole-organizing protein PopZ
MTLDSGNSSHAELLLREGGERGESPMTETSSTRKTDAQEPSMEDILASIRRILAEDTGAAPQDAGLGATSGNVKLAERTDRPPTRTEEVAAEPRSAAVSSADDPFRPDLSAAGPAMEPGINADLEDVFVLSPDMRAGGHPLVSQRAAENSTDVLSQLARAILDRRDIAVTSRDVTLESMVREMLRPLLREWLDRNLPYLIERLVKKEIDVMINRAERLED